MEDTRREARARNDAYDERMRTVLAERAKNRELMQGDFNRSKREILAGFDADRERITGDWRQDRELAGLDWRKTRADIEGRWDESYIEEREELRRLRDFQYGLVNEIKNAPSTVEQQARMNYAKQMAMQASLAASLGRGVSGGDQALRNQMQSASGNILTQTAAARSAENID